MNLICRPRAWVPLLLVGATLFMTTATAGADPSSGDPEAEAAGLKIGRIPKCKQRISVDLPLNRHERREINRVFRCFDKQFSSMEDVVEEFLFAIQTRNADIACRLMTAAEWEDIGGHSCSDRVGEAAEAIAGRDPHVELSTFTSGRNPEGAAIVYLEDPRDGILLELGSVHNHWRLTDTNDFFP